MSFLYQCLFISLVYFVNRVNSGILCDGGFCRTYGFEVGCTATSPNCRINNSTHTGMWLPSPTTCNCCDYCLPFFGAGQYCSVGGPGLGTTVGRCGDGLTCSSESDGHSYCRRMQSKCHSAQDDYDERHINGLTGALESRPQCDGKGKYDTFDCVPTQTCFCQSEEGERIFGEVLNLGATTGRNMHCGCSRLYEKIKKNISPGVPFPVVGARCTSNGDFNPVQCIDRTCFCVNRLTGVIQEGMKTVDLDEKPLTELPCYDATLDLFPQLSEGDPPYNYTTPCLDRMQEEIDLILKGEQEGFNMDFFSEVAECMPDGTFGRVENTRNGSKICVDERGLQLEDYEVEPSSPLFATMDCKCAQTAHLMASSNERPVCCKNGNFRTIQCRRGMCRCVDNDGRQVERESADVTTLSCYTDDWRNC